LDNICGYISNDQTESVRICWDAIWFVMISHFSLEVSMQTNKS
jgi:hypothetical protein